jgi:poly-gamma-glutamate synthesis protein (capsule biosynthesis protein)
MESIIKINIFGDFLTKKGMPELDGGLKELIVDADYNVVNFEAPVKTIDSYPIKKSGPAHCQSVEGPKWLINAGFNVFSLANNHIMDFGKEGLKATQEAFGNTYIGAGTWEEAYKPFLIEKNGLKVALLSLTHCEFGTLTDRYDRRDTSLYGTAWINHPMVDSLVVKLKNEVDYIIVIAHAGIENIEQPLPEWRERYRTLIDLGCSAVMGGHPHIIQGYEEYNGKPIFYSLGNFFFPKDTRKYETWYYSLVVNCKVTKDRIECGFIPIVFDNHLIKVDESNYSQNYMERILTVLNDEKQYIDYVNKECEQLLPFYDYMFYASGYFPLNSKRLLKRILYLPYRLKKKSCSHLLNNIRCESHRWAIIRSLKINNKIQ